MNSKILGSALLIVGTSIGAGMLALPIATAQLGFVGAIGMLVLCWFVMTMSAFYLMEVNLWLPTNSNLISMAKLTTGRKGQMVAWIAYVLLLYSLLCAYIAGGSDLFNHSLKFADIFLPKWLCTCLFTLCFGSIVYLGIRAVDYVNRGLMFFKLSAFVVLIALLMPAVNNTYLEQAQFFTGIRSSEAWMITITSFGFASIVPSLRIYFSGEVTKLKQSLWLGSLIPLMCYVAWILAVKGVLPLTHLQSILQSERSTSDLILALNQASSSSWVPVLTNFFTSICVLTSFLAVSLGLVDFLIDGFRQQREGISYFMMSLLAFLPPTLIVLFWPHIFISALTHAGLYCIVLLVMLPAWMVLAGRDQHAKDSRFVAFGGRWLPIIFLIFSIIMIVGMYVKA